ncbi:MAG: hypothetical protein ACFFCV_21705 [Promethearchaeota archaeon]
MNALKRPLQQYCLSLQDAKKSQHITSGVRREKRYQSINNFLFFEWCYRLITSLILTN